MMNEKEFCNRLDRRLSGLCASGERRQRIREAAAMEARQVLENAPARMDHPPARRLVLVAALLLVLLLACAAAVAYDWNVLAFLGMKQDAPTAGIVTSVDGKVRSGDLTIQINSAVTDGEYLAFDWSLEKQDLENPVYLQVESLTANGLPLSTDGTDDFHCQWVPGIFFGGNDQGGNLCRLPDGLAQERLQVEMVVGVYSPNQPVYQMDVFDETPARQKLAEGYYVIAEGEGFVADLPEDGLCHCFGMVKESTGAGLERTDAVIRFTVDAAAGRATRRTLPLPERVQYPGFTMAYTEAVATALQIRLRIAVTPNENSQEAACALLENGYFDVTDADGEWMETNILEGFGGVEQTMNGRWCAVYECSIAQDMALPKDISLSYVADDGRVFVAPLRIGEGS